MTMRRAIALVGFVCALATLSPVAALANAGQLDRAVKGTGAETISLDTRTGAFTGEISGISSHLGELTGRVEGTGAPMPEGGFAASGSVTLVAANGDRLTGTFTLATTGVIETGSTVTVVVTITGGTGRFAGAAGTLTVICLVATASQVEAMFVSTGTCSMSGTVSY